MKKFFFIALLAFAFCGCQNKQSSNQELVEQVDTVSVIQEDSEPVEQPEEQVISKDFIRGGNTYVGTEEKDVEKLWDDIDGKKGDIIKVKTRYTIKCYNDGTMTWSEDKTRNGGEPSHKNFDGEWKKVTESKHDVVFTWYEFWATTYDMHMNSHYSRIGFVDEKGQLYWEGAEPVTDIPANKYVVCTLSAQ